MIVCPSSNPISAPVLLFVLIGSLGEGMEQPIVLVVADFLSFLTAF